MLGTFNYVQYIYEASQPSMTTWSLLHSYLIFKYMYDGYICSQPLWKYIMLQSTKMSRELEDEIVISYG